MENKEKRWCNVSFGVDINKDVGVYNKIVAQRDAVSRITGNCDLIIFGNDEIYVCTNDGETVKNYTTDIDSDICILSKYDYLYIRWGGANKYFGHILRDGKEYGYKVIVELPSYPIKRELWVKAKGRLKNGQFFPAVKSFIGGIYFQDILLKSQLNRIDHLVLISCEQELSGTNCIHIENGINVFAFQKREVKHHSKIVMMIVANISYWHGIDRIITGINEYENKDDIELRIVGDGDEKSHLEQMVENFHLADTVKFLGIKRGKELDDLYDECDVAIGSLGLSYSGIYASTLKAREYMARGIPFVATKYERVGEDILPYVHIVDEEYAINIGNIVRFVNSIDEQNASDALRKYAVEHCTWDSQMQKVIRLI